jgi:hypothetical protein
MDTALQPTLEELSVQRHSDFSRESAGPRVHGMAGENIICFAKDWDEHATSNNHVMRELARNNKVLWLNSVATRTPNLTSGRDIGKIFRKLKSFLKGARQVDESMWVYTPIVLPFPHNRLARKINRYILGLTLWLLRRKLAMEQFQLWTFLPSSVEYVGTLGESISVYYCVDEWSKFNYLNNEQTAEAERDMCRRADVVFAVAKSLADNRRPLNPETHLSRHGVDHELFSAALDPLTEIPADIANIPQPIIGFYGTLQDWVDLDLIAYLARRHPEWSIVLIGKPMVDLSRVTQFPNVHVLGSKHHSELPAYCKAFSVGIIAYVMIERILHVNPLKLREFLCAGLPVVSVALPEAAELEQFCVLAKDYAEFDRGIAQALATNSPQKAQERSEAMRNETWAARIAEVGAQVMRVKGLKCQ